MFAPESFNAHLGVFHRSGHLQTPAVLAIHQRVNPKPRRKIAKTMHNILCRHCPDWPQLTCFSEFLDPITDIIMRYSVSHGIQIQDPLSHGLQPKTTQPTDSSTVIKNVLHSPAE